MDKHILVTGGAGYIGSHMTLALLAAGERPLVIDDLSTGLRCAVPADVPFFRASSATPTFVGGVMDRLSDRGDHPFRRQHRGAGIGRGPAGLLRNNTANARALIDCAVQRGIPHFVFSSTAAVYGEPDAIADRRGPGRPRRSIPTAAPS